MTTVRGRVDVRVERVVVVVSSFVPIFPLGGTTVESTPNAPREIVTSVSTTRGDGRVFAKLLTVFTHESTSFLDCVIEGNGRNEGTVHFIPYRALHAGRTALIG